MLKVEEKLFFLGIIVSSMKETFLFKHPKIMLQSLYLSSASPHRAANIALSNRKTILQQRID